MAGQSGDARGVMLTLLLLLMLMLKPTICSMATILPTTIPMAGQSGDARGVMLTLLLLLMLMLKPTIASMATILPIMPITDTSMANRDARLNLMPHEHNQNIDSSTTSSPSLTVLSSQSTLQSVMYLMQ